MTDNVKGRGDDTLSITGFCSRKNFDAPDLQDVFPLATPAVPSDEFITSIKRRAHVLGLDISGTGVRNNFTNPDPAKKTADVKHVKEWIDVAVKPGAPVVRIFSGTIPEGYENKSFYCNIK